MISDTPRSTLVINTHLLIEEAGGEYSCDHRKLKKAVIIQHEHEYEIGFGHAFGHRFGYGH
jgi:hypothetical protein